MADKPKDIKGSVKRYYDLPGKKEEPDDAYANWAKKQDKPPEEPGLIEKGIDWYLNLLQNFGQSLRPDDTEQYVPRKPQSIDEANRRYQSLPKKLSGK